MLQNTNILHVLHFISLGLNCIVIFIVSCHFSILEEAICQESGKHREILRRKNIWSKRQKAGGIGFGANIKTEKKGGQFVEEGK